MKRIIAFLMAVFIFCSTFSIAYAANTVFEDVPENYWARNEIEYFASQNIVNGIGNNRFAPDAGVTREEFCKMLVLTFRAPLVNPDEPTFSDVSKNRWSYSYIEVCKELLTGYSNPFGGKPAFHPTEYATREDIAVALVRMMGLTDKDARNPNYAKEKFKDANDISPSLLPYISIAAERGLINGYPNGNFGPQNGITRAEAVVLLNRATKQAVTDINDELELSAYVVNSSDLAPVIADEYKPLLADNFDALVAIYIETEEGATVTIDGEKVDMLTDGSGKYQGVALYEFEEEGTKTFEIVAKKAGKTKSITVTAKYEIGAPNLVITQCPSTSKEETVTIRGNVRDANDYSPVVTINGDSVYVDYRGDWSKTVNLVEGVNNFTITATNSLGKSTTIEKTITFGVSAPTLNITYCPSATNEETATIRGNVKDTNDDSPVVTINGESVYVDYRGDWSKTVKLVEGTNNFKITASNRFGKSTTVERTITFGVGVPTLNITQCPSATNEESVIIRGSVKDTNDDSPVVTINGESVYVDYRGDWSKTVKLVEGANNFKITASNRFGKSITVERTITFEVSAPTLNITQCPSTSNEESVTIRGNVKDTNDDSPVVTINGESVYVDYRGDWSKTVKLVEGTNNFKITASNRFGKSTTVERTIIFNVGSPEIVFTNCPEVTEQKNISIQGYIGGFSDGAKLYVNDQEISVGYNKSFSKSVTLNEGDNTFVFRAVNSYGKSKSVVKTIKYTEIKAPELTVNDVPDTTSEETITISGVVYDGLDPAVNVYVNDKVVASKNGSWSVEVTLNNGSNYIIIVATNKFGRSTTIVKQVTRI